MRKDSISGLRIAVSRAGIGNPLGLASGVTVGKASVCEVKSRKRRRRILGGRDGVGVGGVINACDRQAAMGDCVILDPASWQTALRVDLG